MEELNRPDVKATSGLNKQEIQSLFETFAIAHGREAETLEELLAWSAAISAGLD